MSDWGHIPLSKLQPSKRNIRRKMEGIESLAETIDQHGLIQNLVVAPGLGDTFELVAGERRYRAMMWLVEQERMAPDEPVACLIQDGSEYTWVNTLENLQRRDVPIWEYGRRFTELIEAGHTQTEIAGRLGKSAGYISRAMTIANAISPRILERIAGLKGRKLTDSQLLQMAHIIDRKTLEPDERGQERYLAMCLSSNPRRNGKSKKAGMANKVYARLKKLKAGTSFRIPADYFPAIHAVIRYLEGETRTLRIDLDDVEGYTGARGFGVDVDGRKERG